MKEYIIPAIIVVVIIWIKIKKYQVNKVLDIMEESKRKHNTI